MLKPLLTLAVLITALCTSWLAPDAEAQIYRWVDEHGNVHFGDRRPPQVSEKVEMDTETNRESASEARDRNRQIEDALRIVTDSREHRESEQQAQADAAAQRERQLADCQQMTQYRDRLAAGGFLYRKSDPERKALSDAEIADEIAKLDAAYQRNCTSL